MLAKAKLCTEPVNILSITITEITIIHLLSSSLAFQNPHHCLLVYHQVSIFLWFVWEMKGLYNSIHHVHTFYYQQKSLYGTMVYILSTKVIILCNCLHHVHTSDLCPCATSLLQTCLKLLTYYLLSYYTCRYVTKFHC